jgi:hypothetical protein
LIGVIDWLAPQAHMPAHVPVERLQ